jgi:hypothetical protein
VDGHGADGAPQPHGGDLVIDVDDDLEVTMTGPAAPIYEGTLSPATVRALEAL